MSTVARESKHAQRREEIVLATWRLIARGGFAAATMREIAAEAGFANGGLKHYFANKDELLVAAFRLTFFRINERAAIAIAESSGLEAIRQLCLQMLPLDAEREVECRVSVAFWDRAATNPALRKVHADAHAIWRRWMEQHLDRARATTELVDDVTDEEIIDEILSLVTGMQVIPLLATRAAPTIDQRRLLDGLFERLRSPHVTDDELRRLAADGGALSPLPVAVVPTTTP